MTDIIETENERIEKLNWETEPVKQKPTFTKQDVEDAEEAVGVTPCHRPLI